MRLQQRIWYVALVAAAVGVAAAIPWRASDYFVHVSVSVLYYVILASSWNLLAGYTGPFSLAHHAFAAFGGYTAALLVLRLAVPSIAAILVAAMLTAGVGLVLGFATLRMRAIYLAIATWAFAETFRLVIVAAYPITRGSVGLIVPPLFATRDPRPYYWIFLALSLLTLGAIWLLIRSRYGLYLQAVRDDEVRAESLGIDTTRWKIFGFALSSLLAGVAGACYGFYVSVLSPETIEFYEMGKIIVMVIIGGIGTFFGPVLGALIVQGLSEYFREFGQLRMLFFGVAVIILMRTYRQGSVALIRQLWARFYPPAKRLALRLRASQRAN